MSPPSSTLSEVEFAQREPLTTRLRGLVRSYPKGIGIVQEFIQNADDAGATHLWLVFDQRTHPSDALPSPEMTLLQGPALLFANDARFSEEDWSRIQRIGESGKALDTSKTGRFGLGFNSAYNVTDYPGLLTGTRVGYFDPHTTTVHGASFARPGNAWLLDEGLWQSCPDLLAPFRIFGLQPGERVFDGTVFRLPLRTEKHARESEISQQPFLPSDFTRIVDRIREQGAEFLLFLKHVLSIRVSQVGPDGTLVDLLHVETLNDEEVDSARGLIRFDPPPRDSGSDEEEQGEDSNRVAEFLHAIQIRSSDGDPTRESWSVVHGRFVDPAGSLLEAAQEMRSFGEKAIPLAGAAVRNDSSGADRDFTGRLFCGLPLPSSSSFTPCHVHGFFDLQSDRQSIFSDQGVEGKGAARVRWNELLLEHACAEAVARLCSSTARRELDLGRDPYKIWPNVQSDSRLLLQDLPRYVYARLYDHHDCIAVGADSRWSAPSDVLLDRSSSDDLHAALLADDFSVPNPCLPQRVVNGFKAAGNPLAELTAQQLREELRTESSTEFELRSAPRESLKRREWLLALLRFSCEDGEFDDLQGVPLALRADAQVRPFGGATEDAVFLADEQTRSLLESHPEWFIDVEIDDLDLLEPSEDAGIQEMTPERVTSLLPRILLNLDEGTRIDWDPDQAGVPSNQWLIEFYRYVADFNEDFSLDLDVLRTLPLVPDQFGRLWGMGHERTPLLPASTREQGQLVGALKPFGVPIVEGDSDLMREIRRFVQAFEDKAIWSISTRDLIDTMAAMRDEWDESVATYSPEIHPRVLNFFATPASVKGLRESFSNRIDRLRSLPIFPTIARELVALQDSDVFIPEAFELPEIQASLGFLDTGPTSRWADLLSLLGVPTLTRARLIREILLPQYSDLSESDQITALKWLRTNLQFALDDLEARSEEDADEFVQEIRSAELVCCTDGEFRSPDSTYHPEAEVALDLLGRDVGFPDMSTYSDHPARWLDFFSELGMSSVPRVRDIVSVIDEITQDPVEISREELEKLQGIVAYLGDHWVDLRDAPLGPPGGDDSGSQTTLAEALAGRRWLPALQRPPLGFPAELFEAPNAVLFSPSDLCARESLDLVASVETVCSIRSLGGLASDLGVQRSPEVESVLQHLEVTAEYFDSCDREDRRKSSRILKSIYRFLGSSFRTAEGEDLASEADAAAVAERFEATACVIDAEGQLWTPSRAFAEPVPYFLGRRGSVRAQYPDIESGLRVLGRRDGPEVGDFAAVLDEVEQGLEEDPASPEQVLHLRDAIRRAAACSGGEASLSDAPVLTADCHLESPQNLVMDDAPWVVERAEAAGIPILDRELGPEVAAAFGVALLSRAVYEAPVDVDEAAPAEFQQTCRSLNDLIQTLEFARGVRRLLEAAGYRVAATALEWLRTTRVRSVGRLTSILVWTDRDEPIEGSEGVCDVLFDPDSSSVIVSVEADGVVPERVAEVLNQELHADGLDLGDRSALVAILRERPDRIDALLTRLRVPALVLSADDVGQQEWEQTGFIDEGYTGVDHETLTDSSSESSEVREERGGIQPTEAQAEVTAATGEAPQHEEDAETPTQHDRGVSARAPESQTFETALEGEEESASERADTDTGGVPAGGQPSEGFWGLADRDRGRARGYGSRHAPESSRSRSRAGEAQARRAVTYVVGGVEGSSESEAVKERRDRVDRAAIDRAMEFERDQGREPTEMPHGNPGYDIESFDDSGILVRYIEVKGLGGAWTDFGVAVSPRQLQHAERESERFWLYVVEFALETERACIHAIQDPVSLIDEYRFDGGWKLFSGERGGASPLGTPREGLTVLVDGTRRGRIERIHKRGRLMQLHILFEDAEASTPLVYTPSRIEIITEE